MSLSSIARRLGISAAPHIDRPASLALVFLLEASYLDAFRVFALSLAVTGSFIDDPVVILSPDRDVLADPLVARICDLRILISAAEISRFEAIRSDAIEERFRLPWIAKFTFLKWLAYRDFGFDWHLILDADMLALQNLESFASERGNCQFICCPKFPARPPRGRLARAIQALGQGGGEEVRFLREFLDRNHTIASKARINSGIQLVGRKLLSGDFADELIDLARSRGFPNEQAVLTEYFRTHDAAGHAFRSPAYNFKAPSLAALAPAQSANLLPEIANLHFVGRAKPWQALNSRRLDGPASLWWQHAAVVCRHSDFFGAERLTATSEQVGATAVDLVRAQAGFTPAPALPPD